MSAELLCLCPDVGSPIDIVDSVGHPRAIRERPLLAQRLRLDRINLVESCEHFEAKMQVPILSFILVMATVNALQYNQLL